MSKRFCIGLKKSDGVAPQMTRLLSTKAELVCAEQAGGSLAGVPDTAQPASLAAAVPAAPQPPHLPLHPQIPHLVDPWYASPHFHVANGTRKLLWHTRKSQTGSLAVWSC